MYVIALYGGIGSGKSTVTKLFQGLGVSVIDMDDISREVVTPGTDTLDKIAKYFGENILDTGMQLDRKKLREIIFNDPDKKLWLENLLHPIIRNETQEKINDAPGDYCIVAIPLLKAKQDMYDRYCLVDTGIENQIERVMERDGLSHKEALNIINQQISRQDKLLLADDIINNSGDVTDLEAQVMSLHHEYLQTAKNHNE